MEDVKKKVCRCKSGEKKGSGKNSGTSENDNWICPDCGKDSKGFTPLKIDFGG